MRFGIIGAGLIGREVYNQSREQGWELDFVASRTGIYRDIDKKTPHENQDLRAHSPDLVFLAIPTFDDGQTAFNYIRSFASRGIPVVTAEKGALSNYRIELDPFMERIRYNASVGGGTRMLKHFEWINPANISEIHAVVNGTLNYMMRGLSQNPNSLDRLAHECKEKGYAEPGSEDALNIINQEAVGDVPMKTAIICNRSGLFSTKIRAVDFVPEKIKPAELEILAQEAGKIRFIVSITPEGENSNNRIGGFEYVVDNWRIKAGFVQLDNKMKRSYLDVPRASNALMVVNNNLQVYHLVGAGAGAVPTVQTMIADAKELLA